MADINFNDDSDKKKPGKRDPVMMLLIAIAVITIITVAIIGMGMATQLSELESELARIEDFMRSSEAQLQEYHDTQDRIAELQRTRRPLHIAYKFCKRLNTATSSLIEDTIFDPIIGKRGNMTFAGLQIAGLRINMEVGAHDLDTMRRYQTLLEGKTVVVDSYGADKIPGAPRAEGDEEILRYSDRFTYEYAIDDEEEDEDEVPFDVLFGLEGRESARQFHQLGDVSEDEYVGTPYVVLFRARLNKVVPNEVFNVLGSGW